MDNEIIDNILPYLSLGLLAIFAVFLVLSMLFGFARGGKRATLRLITFGGLLIVAFFVTPFIVNWVLGLDVQFNGQTPRQFVDELSERLVQYLQENFGDYVTPFQDYIKEYALGIVLSALNLVIFFGLYFIVKPVSWGIYSVLAHFTAPKRDKKGNRLPKHAGLGLLVGAVQGVLLFIIFMFPINGVVGVVNHATEYQAAQTDSQQMTTQAVGGHNGHSNNEFDVEALLQKVDQPLKMYNQFMKMSGLQYLSDRAFEYQLTLRIDGAENINLVHDINNGVELYIDSKDFMTVVEKLKNAYSGGRLDLTDLTEKDYQIIRNFINKVFDMQILNVADDLLGDLDKIFRTPFNDDETKLAGTEIYENSIYGLLTKQNATARTFTYVLEPGQEAPTNYAQFASGLQNVIQYISDQKLDLVRNDLINIIDFVEALNVYKIKCEGATETKTMAAILAQGNLSVKDYFDLITAKLVESYDNYQVGTPLINVFGDNLLQFSAVKMVGLKDFDNLLVYSKMMDHTFDDNQDLKKLINELIPMFLGENALTHDNALGGKVQGNWEKLGDDLLDVAHVLRNYVTIVDDINNIQAELIRDGKVEDGPAAQPMALLEYLSRLVISENDYNAGKETIYAGMSYDEVKFQRVDELVDVLYKLMNDFEPVKTFAVKKLESMQTGEMSSYMQSLTTMFDKNINEWRSTMRSVVNMARLINQSPLANLLTDFEDPSNLSNLDAEDFMDVVTSMNASDVTDVLSNIMDVPEIGDKVQETLTSVLDKLNDQSSEEAANASKQALEQYLSANSDVGVTITDQDVEKVQDAITELQSVLNQFDETTYNSMTEEEQEALKTSTLPSAVGGLWGMVQSLLHPENN